MRYKSTFSFFDREADAVKFCEQENATGSYYKRTKYKAYYLPYSTSDGWNGFIVWYRR